MPVRAKRPCAQPGCAALVDNGYCSDHAKHSRSSDARRGNSAQRGYDWKWRKAREQFIARQFAGGNVFCAMCGKPFFNPSDVEVDHKIPHRGNSRLFWDRSNWQMLDSACHKRKTAKGL